MVHYVRNYMLHMPFTHRSTLTMNTNRFSVEGDGEILSAAGNINVDYLLGISLPGNNPIFHLCFHHSFSLKWQKEFSQDHGIEGIKFLTHLQATTMHD